MFGKIASFMIVCAVSGAAIGAELIGTAAVSVTGQTAAAAKDSAFDSARRQIIPMALRGVADASAVSTAVRRAGNTELANMVAATTIDGERISDTTYAANITMTLDENATRAWLNANGVQNWLGTNTANIDAGGIIAYVKVGAGLADWVSLNRATHDAGVNLTTRNITGRNMTVEIPVSGRNKFLGAITGSGWHYADHGGVLQIWR
ncbi:MAG: hypothetical protein IJ560_04595 [Alphaproteobacteria bacterium]|nr:hypothetical protein [Alphaproteobacteria bacterium]